MLTPGWPLVALLAWGVLTFGAVYPWAYWPLFAGAATLGAVGVAREKAWRDPRLKLLGITLIVLAAAIWLQTVALPARIVTQVSPSIDAFFRQYRVPYHPASLQTLSLDAAATRVVLVEMVALSLLLVGCARLMRRWPHEWLVNQIMALAVAVALSGIVQRALVDTSDPRIYGFWRPAEAGGNPFGPFVNRNHFAGWMVMVVPLVTAYGWALVQRAGGDIERRSGWWLRWIGEVEGNRVLLVGSSVLIMAVSLVMTGSRSGMAACAAAMAVLMVFMWRTIHGAARWVAMAGVLAVLVGAATWAGADMVASRFARASGDAHGRVGAWRDTWRIVADFPLTGTGLGGYRSAMLVYQTGDRNAMYAQAHNDYLQVLAEGGILVTVPALVAFGVLTIGIIRRLGGADDNAVTFWLRRGAVAGLVGVAAQSVVEFSLQIPGNAVMCVALTALALHRPRSHAHAHRV